MNSKLKNILYLFLFFFTLFSIPLNAQLINQPIKWSSRFVDLGAGLYEIQITGVISDDKKDWHIYDLGPYTDGPTPTSLVIILPQTKDSNAQIEGLPYLLTPVKQKFDEMFGMEIGVCQDRVTVAQKIRVKGVDSIKVIAVIEWQACDNSSCLPPTEREFSITLPGLAEKTSEKTSKESSEESAGELADDNISTVDAANSVQTTPTPSNGRSLWGVIIEAIIWGFVALLTPCVFPMVPMTVSFFLKSSSKVMASFFGLCIVALYTLPIGAIIVATYFAGGEAVTADIFNWLATHWVPNVLFFIIFMLFAASFFGAFEIVLPSWLVNKSDSKSDKGGYIGVFFMALTLVLVSFSCTGPIVGTILIKSTQGDIWEPIITMLAFSGAFALPFTIFAFAPSLLKNLPKSGGWLNSVKVVLGFIEVALGFKFLSVADQVYHWGLLDREIYLAIWIVVFTLMGLYLLGKIRFAHDTPQEHLSVKRLTLAIVTFSFVVYMIPGMWGAPLKGLSGYLPPMSSQDFISSGQSTGLSQESGHSSSDNRGATYSNFLHLPHGLKGFFRYSEGLEYARKVGKPLFIDFTGHGCVNCREMEARVWSDSRVLKLLRDEFVIVALYADDKTTAIESDWITTESGRVLKSIGKINSHLAMNKYKVNAQPYYAIIDPTTEEHLTKPRGYNLDVEQFIEFLKSVM